MSFRDKEATYRQYSSEEIYWLLQSDQKTMDVQDLFLCCDQLLQRRMIIRYVELPFETIIRKLPKDIWRFIAQFDENFSTASVHVVLRLLESAGRDIKTWYYLEDNGLQEGPVDRFTIEEVIKLKPNPHRLIWRQGWELWTKESDLEYLIKPEYYDQEAVEKKVNFKTGKNQKKVASPSSLPIVAGIMVLASFPFWVINSLALPISSVGSVTGWFLPLIFGLFMLISVIPVGIGLICKRPWAWSIKITSSVLLLLWFLFHALLDGSGMWWVAVALYEFIILTLVLFSKDDFKNLRYEQQHPA